MLIQGDAVRIPLPDKSVHCVTTSPPYWGLRKYSGEQGRGMFPDLGLEKTPQEHIERIVQIMADVHRVLRDDGVVWLNYGDCYSAKSTSKGKGKTNNKYRREGSLLDEKGAGEIERFDGLSAGNLMLMPHRIAIALQDWGWIVRNDVVWWKRNPMPESQAGWRFERERKEKSRIKEGGAQMTNLASMDAGIGGGKDKVEWEYLEDYQLRKGSWRHTRAHEYVFMLTKKMQYWANQEAVREITGNEFSQEDYEELKRTKTWESGKLITGNANPGYTAGRSHPGGRNPRSVMDVPTAPYKGAHYATFPPNLIAPLIRATCPRWACPVCGQGWSPVVEKSFEPQDDVSIEKGIRGHQDQKAMDESSDWQGYPRGSNHSNIKEYRPTCEHDHTKDEAAPGIVLDPFVGSGTTVMVAKQLLRRGIGLDISMEYIDQQAKIRTGEGSPSNILDDLPLFAELES